MNTKIYQRITNFPQAPILTPSVKEVGNILTMKISDIFSNYFDLNELKRISVTNLCYPLPEHRLHETIKDLVIELFDKLNLEPFFTYQLVPDWPDTNTLQRSLVLYAASDDKLEHPISIDFNMEETVIDSRTMENQLYIKDISFTNDAPLCNIIGIYEPMVDLLKTSFNKQSLFCSREIDCGLANCISNTLKDFAKKTEQYSLEFSKAVQYEDCPLIHIGDTILFAEEEYVVTETSMDTMGSSSYLVCHVENEEGNRKKLRYSDCGYYWDVKTPEELTHPQSITM